MIWKAALPNGTIMEGTTSATAQEATAKAMRMDVPRGCSVDPYDAVTGEKLPNPNDETNSRNGESYKSKMTDQTVTVLGITFRKMFGNDYDGFAGAGPNSYIREVDDRILIWDPDELILSEMYEENGKQYQRDWKYTDIL